MDHHADSKADSEASQIAVIAWAQVPIAYVWGKSSSAITSMIHTCSTTVHTLIHNGTALTDTVEVILWYHTTKFFKATPQPCKVDIKSERALQADHGIH